MLWIFCFDLKFRKNVSPYFDHLFLSRQLYRTFKPFKFSFIFKHCRVIVIQIVLKRYCNNVLNLLISVKDLQSSKK